MTSEICNLALRWLHRPRNIARVLALSSVSILGLSAAAVAAPPVPTVSFPPAGRGAPFLLSALDLASFGYSEQEFFISGSAQSFVNAGTLNHDGRWGVSPGVTTPYTTRILVRRPTNPKKFNGVVVVEWLNVSGGIDTAPEFDFDHVELLREGYAWVGVSAQFVGASFLHVFDSVRYASIFQPGDSWSYDIFSQAAEAIQHGNPQPLGALTPFAREYVAAGESQSAFRLFTYYNAVEPEARVYQGLLIHSAGSGSPLSQSSAGTFGGASIPAPPGVPATPDIPVPPTAFIRNDLRQPVLFLNTETDVTVLGAGLSVHREPDSHVFRMWEIAGTTHADAYLLQQAAADAAKSGLFGALVCGDPPVNNGPETFATRTAIHALAIWTGLPSLAPSIGPRLAVHYVKEPVPAAMIDRNKATGNAIGGIRLPQIAVPIETLTGIRPPAALAANPNCALVGAADPWDGDTDPWDGVAGLDPSPTPEPSLFRLYGTKRNYLGLYGLAEQQSVAHGFLLPQDVKEVFGLATAANVPEGTVSNATSIPNP